MLQIYTYGTAPSAYATLGRLITYSEGLKRLINVAILTKLILLAAHLLSKYFSDLLIQLVNSDKKA